MKHYIFIALLMLGCKITTQKNLADTVFEYTATTRGYFQKIVVKNQTIAVSNERGATTMPTATQISKKDWATITAATKKIKLENLPNLVAPSELRHTDAAAFATLKIFQNTKEYQSAQFDNGNPPAEIAELVNMITKLAQKAPSKK